MAIWLDIDLNHIGNPTNNQYFIPSINKSKMWLRHELLKV